MPDMLVRLYSLPEATSLLVELGTHGIAVRRAFVPEKKIITEWVHEHFGAGWASEADVCFANKPVSCFVAITNQAPIGFACYDATCKDFVGPIGVAEAVRGCGVGKALLLSCLYSMKEIGYAYGVIGAVGPAQEFFTRTVGAVPIEGSDPGFLRGKLF